MNRSLKTKIPPLREVEETDNSKKLTELQNENRELRSLVSTKTQWREKYHDLLEKSTKAIKELQEENQNLKMQIFQYQEEDRERSPDYAPIKQHLEELKNENQKLQEKIKEMEKSSHEIPTSTLCILQKDPNPIDQSDSNNQIIQEKDAEISALKQYILELEKRNDQLLSMDPEAIEIARVEKTEAIKRRLSQLEEVNLTIQKDMESLKEENTRLLHNVDDIDKQLRSKDQILVDNQAKIKKSDSTFSKMDRVFRHCKDQGFL